MSAYDDLKFAPMLITDVFESMKASTAWFDKSNLKTTDGNRYPFVSRTKTGNGVDGFCSRQEKPPENGNAITIGLDTQTIGYQPVPFYTSQNIQVLRHPLLTQTGGLVLAACIREQMGKFSWGGNGATLGRLKKTRIMVPIAQAGTTGRVVDWEGIARLGEGLMARAAAHLRAVRMSEILDPASELPDLTFEPMYVIDVPGKQRGIFRAHKGKRLITADRKRGSVPFIAGSRLNNSIVDFAEVPALFPGGWLTLIYNGDGGTGHCKYQPMAFSASDDVTALEPLAAEATEPALLMMATLLTHQCVPKFGFGYKLTLHRLGRQKILVPVVIDEDGSRDVDWDGMSRYGQIIRARVERDMTVVAGDG